MRIAQVRARCFRIFERFELAAHPRLNLLIGDNGAGKTSILEALFVLGRASGYRDTAQDLLRHGCEAWRVEGWTDPDDEGPRGRIQVDFREGGTSIEVNDRAVRAAELVRLLPILVVDPGLHRLLEQGPSFRRRFFDWGVFHVEHEFHGVWRRLRRILRQRNAALKESPSQARIWNPELSEISARITAMREAYVANLEALLRLQLQHLLPGEQWGLVFQAGWNGGIPYSELLEARLERDRRFGHTVEGPHRAELLMFRDGRPARHVVSRGHQKLLISALSLAQAQLVGEATSRFPIVLLDDFTAELSAESQRRLAQRLADYPGQKFVTALERPAALVEQDELSVFHVEHGTLRALVK